MNGAGTTFRVYRSLGHVLRGVTQQLPLYTNLYFGLSLMYCCGLRPAIQMSILLRSNEML